MLRGSQGGHRFRSANSTFGETETTFFQPKLRRTFGRAKHFDTLPRRCFVSSKPVLHTPKATSAREVRATDTRLERNVCIVSYRVFGYTAPQSAGLLCLDELQKSEREKPHCGETNQHAPTQTSCNQPAIAVLTHQQTNSRTSTVTKRTPYTCPIMTSALALQSPHRNTNPALAR